MRLYNHFDCDEIIDGLQKQHKPRTGGQRSSTTLFELWLCREEKLLDVLENKTPSNVAIFKYINNISMTTIT